MAQVKDSGESAKRKRVSPRKKKGEDEVITEIKRMIDDCGGGLLPQKECCIFRAPATLRHLNEKAYTPQFVSIGPFHHDNEKLDNEKLKKMERHKQILFKKFTEVASSWQDLVPFVEKDLVPKVRESYSETINLTLKQLVKLILMDAGFIIELFISKEKLLEEWLEDSIRDDLLLIENQLPFFVIEELFNKAIPHNHDCRNGRSFLEVTFDYFRYYNKQKLEPKPNVRIKHFTDLLRLFYIGGEMPQREYLHEEMPQQDDLHEEMPQRDDLHAEMPQRDDLHVEMPQRDDSSIGAGSHILLYNANALQEAGIKLKASKSKCILDLKFSGHILEIPQILVEDGTEVVFRNMIAFEQCRYPENACITNYALILDRLIDTSKDVDLLVNEKIVSHYLGDSHKVALFFNDLCKNVVQTNFNPNYVTICKELNKYCANGWHKIMATLRRDYCNTPWRTVASIGGIFLLVLTIVQTIFSVLQVVLK